MHCLICQITNQIFTKFYLYAKNWYEAKKQLLINKCGDAGIKYFHDSDPFIDNSSNMDDIYKNIEEYSPNKKWKISIVFHDMFANMFINNRIDPIVEVEN